MDIGPTPAMLESYRSQKLPWDILLGELVDNSLDSAATRVEISFLNKTSIDVSDDGTGCKDVRNMLKLGAHMRQPSTRLGRFGVGLKEAAVGLWGKLDIKTAHSGKLRYVIVDWNVLSKRAEWIISDPDESDADDFKGTHLKFRKVEKEPPRDYQKLADDLGYMFMPALEKGVQIKVDRTRGKSILCKPHKLPPISDIVDAEFEVAGKLVKLHAGIVEPEHINRRAGFTFVLGHRVIMNSALGNKGLSVSRVAGIIELASGWSLTKNKTDISGGDDELADAIHERIREMLLKAANQATTLAAEAFTKELNKRFKVALNLLAGKSVKEKRDKPPPDEQEHGTVKPQNTGRKRKPKKVQPDSLSNHAQSFFSRGGTIDWKPFDHETFGEVDLPGSVIWLNENDKTLANYRDADNQDAVIGTAMGLFVVEASQVDQQDKFPMFRTTDKFPINWALAMSSCATANAKAMTH